MSNSTRPPLGRFLLFVASFLLAVASARAEFAVVQLTTNHGVIGGGNPAIGWEFTPARPILITKLGYFDAHFNGFVTSHELGIFSVATESLVTSALIDAGLSAPIEGPHVAGGGFRYVSAPSVVLTPGTNYIIAATPVGYIDQTASFQPIGNNHQLETAPDILFIQGRYNYFEPPGLEFPEDESPNVEFGPSFQFEVVPEPATYLPCAFAMLGLLAMMASRKF